MCCIFCNYHVELNELSCVPSHRTVVDVAVLFVALNCLKFLLIFTADIAEPSTQNVRYPTGNLAIINNGV